MRSWESIDSPIILAHRGGADEHPENSIEAFTAMVEKGFTYIETDVHATADGKLVIIHDPLLDRTTNGSGLIAMTTWDEVSKLHDESGRRPMLLEEALELFPDVDFNIDIKADSAVDPIISLMKSGDYLDRVLVASFSEKRLRRIRRAVPGVATSLGKAAVIKVFLASRVPTKKGRWLLRGVPGPSRGVVCAQLPKKFRGIRILDKRLIDTIHDMGLAVHAWTINEAMDMSRLLRVGVDGIITDRPTLAREVIENHQKRSRSTID